jgi:transcriptional regulator with XRE-family HTH domain
MPTEPLKLKQGRKWSMANIREVLAANMKAYRNALGLSQAKLAEKVNTSTHYIGMIETKNNFPSPEMLERIAAALGIDATALFAKDDSQTEAIKTYLKAALEGIKNDIGQAIDARLKEMDKEI